MSNISPKRVPLSISREDLLEDVLFDEVDQKAKEVPGGKLDNFDSLVEYLTKDIHEPLLKVRVLFSWLGDQDILNKDYGNVESDTPQGMLKAIQENYDYNHIFNKLCRCAGIPCYLIEGHQRLLPNDDDKLAIQPSSWCAVFVKGWRFVVPIRCFLGLFGDVTGKNWQKVEQDGKKTQENDMVSNVLKHMFEENFFLMDPANMIYFYRPNDDKWQLLKTPMSEALFISQPCVFPSFFESGLQLRKGQQAEVRAQNGHANIVLTTTEKNWSDRLMYALYFRTRQEKEFPDNVSADKFVVLSNPNPKGEINIEVRFPVEGIYRLNFQLESKLPFFLLKFILKCDDARFKCKPLPITPQIGWGPGKEAKEVGIKDISHTEGVIHPKASEDLKIEFKVKPGTTISTRYLSSTKPANDQEMKKRVKTRVRHGDVRIEVNPIDGEGVIEINASRKGEPSQNIINYLVSTEEKPKRLKLTETPKEKEDKSTLKEALKEGKLADLKDALANYIRHDVEDEKIITEATERIHFLQIKQDLQDAILRRHKGVLEQAITAAEALESHRNIIKLINKAKDLLKHLEQQGQVTVEVLAMKQTTISEIHSYNHPKQVVHDVMMATFSLLGEKIAYLDDWEMIQNLTRKTGKEGLLRKIRKFEVSSVGEAARCFAKEKIDMYEEDVVRLASGGAGTFYKWCKSVLNEISVSREDHHDDVKNE